MYALTVDIHRVADKVLEFLFGRDFFGYRQMWQGFTEIIHKESQSFPGDKAIIRDDACDLQWVVRFQFIGQPAVRYFE